MSGTDSAADWARLFRIARSLIKQVNVNERIIDHWTFGGGTAIMLQIDHRESHDVDLFLNDVQLLPFLDPKNHDFVFEIVPSDYEGDGTSFIKISFDGIGEIDFIVRQALPTLRQSSVRSRENKLYSRPFPRSSRKRL